MTRNQRNRTIVRGRFGAENRVLPASLATTGELADTYKEAST